MAPTDRDNDAPDASPSADEAPARTPAVPDDDSRALPTGSSPAESSPDRLPARPDAAEPQAIGPGAAADDDHQEDASVELPRFVQPDRALPSSRPSEPPATDASTPEPRPDSARRGSRAPKSDDSEWAPKPLVSGDPLLTGPNPVVKRSEPRQVEPAPESAAKSAAEPRPEPSPDRGEQRRAVAPPPDKRRESEAPPPAPQRRPEPTPPPPPRSRPTAPATAAAGAGAIGGVVVPGGPIDASGRTARRASRGAYVQSQQPTRQVARPADPSGPVPTLRPTTVAPVPRLAGRRPRVRRVTRVVRHVDPWSVFKVAAVFSLVAYAIALVAGVLLWNVAYSTGTIDNIERGMESTGWSVFELEGGEIFHNAWIGGLFIAVGMTGLAVLVATLFNLITDLVGGVRFTVLEEEVIEKTASPMRRFTTRRDDPRQQQQQPRTR